MLFLGNYLLVVFDMLTLGSGIKAEPYQIGAISNHGDTFLRLDNLFYSFSRFVLRSFFFNCKNFKMLIFISQKEISRKFYLAIL